MKNPDYYVRYVDFGYSDADSRKKLTFSDWLIIGIFTLCLIFTFCFVNGIVNTYNNLVKTEIEVDVAFANVQSAMWDRLEKISYLEKKIQKIDEHIGNIVGNIYSTRSAIESATTPEELERIDAEITNSINSFLVLVEDYPAITKNEEYIVWLERIKKITTQIMVEKEKYNTVVEIYNELVTNFPSSLVAKILDFYTRDLF